MQLRYTTLLFIITLPALAQTNLTGRVTDRQVQGIPLANVILAGTYDGATTDNEGAFSFETFETGSQKLIIKFVGYKDFEQDVVLAGKTLVVHAALEETINELDAVEITAGSFMASDESRRTVLKAIDIATTAGATADIAGTLNTLPGTQKVAESGRLFVRGGDGNETKTFIDGMLVLDAYGPAAPNTPSRGRFLPFMFKGTSFSTGGYSAEYGQALSSALVLDSRDKAGMTRTDIGLLSVGGDVAHTQAWKRGSVAGKLQYTNIRPYFGLINQEIDWRTPPASWEGVGAFRHEVGKTGLVKVYGNMSRTDFSLYEHAIDNPASRVAYALQNDYRYINGFYKDVLSERWTVRGGAAYTYQQNDSHAGTTATLETEKGIHAKTVFEGSLTDKVELKTGAEVLQRRYSQDIYTDGMPAAIRAFDETCIAVFTEADVYTSNRFVTRAGARGEYNTLTGSASVDPRVSMAYKTGNVGQVSLAYGIFRQTANNTWVRLNANLEAEKAEHYILNYQRVTGGRTFRVETYYKRYRDLVKYTGTPSPAQINNTGRGNAQGVELFWRDNETVRGVDYWVSYSFLDTRRNYLNYPESAMPAFASRHNTSLVVKYFIESLKSQVGTTWSYTSGRPYNNPNKTSFNSERTPYYSDLSVNWSYLPKPYLIVYFSCTNVLGRDNIFGYTYSDTPTADGFYNSRPVRQAAPRFLFVGIFLTLSKDKSVNQLPTL
ncbi:carboxypeptidase-like regulatory domain-containing protein [Fulvivirgaceae bacterium PWU5]|uniref:Carboxypeptidase-like regulatory domain-containing protein n=1 Tax=Dawidia cretensis TaxID=2782350 RepID=A0AAP2GQ74_9BACT|nr:TonB-dependent receptor [Dawidia cretensis]MBT1709376.1 carboxypeptidase-like regulatory domain-containing protein [Dawidia cretensis]